MDETSSTNEKGISRFLVNFYSQVTSLVSFLFSYVVEKPLSSFLWLVIIVVILFLIQMAIWADDYPSWVGFGAYYEQEPRGKTLWEWMDLLIVPIVLAMGAWWLNRTQKATELELAARHRANELEIAEGRRQEEGKIAEERLESDKAIAAEQQHQAMLEAYFDKTTELLLKYNLRGSDENDEVRSVARSRTLSVLRMLDGKRKGLIVRFLYESKLIYRDDPIVKLANADLSGADLESAELEEVDLSLVNLSSANFEEANLKEANLQGMVAPNINLRQAVLSKAELSESCLFRADLWEAQLFYAKLEGADLRSANMATANASGADFSKALLMNAIITDAYLIGSKFQDAAYLELADKWESEDVWKEKEEKFWASAKTLNGSIMPDGVVYEDWVEQRIANDSKSLSDN